MGGYTAPSTCRDDKYCECATQGRSQICAQEEHERTSTFGAHAINCTYHPYGAMPLEEMERKVTHEVGNFSVYNQHMDNHMSVYTKDLASYISKLEKDDYRNLRTTWQQSEGTYYAVVAEACPGYFVEIFSDVDPGLDQDSFTVMNEHRIDADLLAEFTDSSESVVKVSRATTKIDEMVSFYTDIVGGELVSNKTEKDGTILAIVKLWHAETQLHFVKRAAPENAKFTVADYEEYANSVHDKYIKSTNCGFDQYADMHWAYDSREHDITLSSVSKKLEEAGHKYRWFGVPGGKHQIYAFDPSGWTIQLNLMDGNDVPSKTASYSAACKSDDGCYGQGLCDNAKEGQFYYATKTWEFFLN